MSELQNFYEELQADVITEANGSDGESESDFKVNAFTRIVIEDLASAGVLESPIECYYQATISGLSVKVNAYSIPEEDSRLDLVITEYFNTSEPTKITSADIERSRNQVVRFLKTTLAGRHNSEESGTESYGMMREIHSIKDDIDRVQILLITNAIGVQRKEKPWNETLESYKLNFDIWDLERLRRFRSSGASHEPIEVDLSEYKHGGIQCIAVSDNSLGYNTCVAIVPGTVLHDWYDAFGASLLELNVRSYLQARGKVNSGILETLIKHPQHFLAYNNGITIVAERLSFDSTGSIITGIHGLQIVNGGQTTASIHRAKKDNQADLSHVYVQAKLTVVPADVFETMVPEISRYSNTQNKVSEVDLRANHNYHVGIERVAKRTWAPGEQSMWFYERARGSYQTLRSREATTPAQKMKFDIKFPASQRLSKEDLARYANVWNGLPHIVNRGGQKNFTRFMESVPNVPKDWEPSAEEFKSIIAKGIFYKKVQQLAKEIDIPAFRINVVNYTVALMAEKTARRIDLVAIWERQGLSDAMREQIVSWLPLVADCIIKTAGSRNPGEWFKTEQCWKTLIAASSDWKTSQSFLSQLTRLGDKEFDISNETQNNMARCLEVDVQQWFKIQIWGSESGQLKDWQIGIANTLAGYAAQGWKKKPSEKQASHAMEIVRLYKESFSEDVKFQP